QLNQDLCRRLSVGKRAMTRSSCRTEELRERGETGARRAAGKQAPREPDGVDDGPGQPRSGEPFCLAVEKREVEARVVRDEHGLAGKLEKSAHGDARMSLAAQFCVVETCQGADRRRERDARIDEQLELLLELEFPHAHRAAPRRAPPAGPPNRAGVACPPG